MPIFFHELIIPRCSFTECLLSPLLLNCRKPIQSSAYWRSLLAFAVWIQVSPNFASVVHPWKWKKRDENSIESGNTSTYSAAKHWFLKLPESTQRAENYHVNMTTKSTFRQISWPRVRNLSSCPHSTETVWRATTPVFALGKSFVFQKMVGC